MRKSVFVVSLLVVFQLAGCYSGMALKKGENDIDLSSKSIALLSVGVINKNHAEYPLKVVGININEWGNLYKANDAFQYNKDGYKEYLLTLELTPGVNILHSIWISSDGFWVDASAHPSLNLRTNITPNSVVYLGHIDIVLRKKIMESEETAGSIPLIDAGIVGFSSGTFDISVLDRFEEDIKTSISAYPALKNTLVTKAILPQITR